MCYTAFKERQSQISCDSERAHEEVSFFYCEQGLYRLTLASGMPCERVLNVTKLYLRVEYQSDVFVVPVVVIINP